MATNEYMSFEVAPYALPSVLLALYNEGIKNISVTKSDDNIEISVFIHDLKASVYRHDLKVPDLCTSTSNDTNIWVCEKDLIKYCEVE